MAYTAAKVRHVSLVLIGLLVTLVAFAGSPMTAETAPAATTVVLAVDPDWRTTDPANAYERHGQLILRVIYDPLVRLADGKIQPWLAES